MTLKEQINRLVEQNNLYYFSIKTTTTMLFNNFPKYPMIFMPCSKLLKKTLLNYGECEVLSVTKHIDIDYGFEFKEIFIDT